MNYQISHTGPASVPPEEVERPIPDSLHPNWYKDQPVIQSILQSKLPAGTAIRVRPAYGSPPARIYPTPLVGFSHSLEGAHTLENQSASPAPKDPFFSTIRSESRGGQVCPSYDDDGATASAAAPPAECPDCYFGFLRPYRTQNPRRLPCVFRLVDVPRRREGRASDPATGDQEISPPKTLHPPVSLSPKCPDIWPSMELGVAKPRHISAGSNYSF